MATEVDICNMALSLLGDTATVTSIDPPEGSAQSDHCARFYPQALSELISVYPWTFATRRVKLSPLVAKPVGGENLFAFPIPSDCLRIMNVESEDIPEYRNIQFRKEFVNNQHVIVTAAETVWVKYISTKVSSDTFPPYFVTALVYRLAAYLAGPVVPGSSGSEMSARMYKEYTTALPIAQQADAVQRFEKESFHSKFLGDAVMEPDHAIY